MILYAEKGRWTVQVDEEGWKDKNPERIIAYKLVKRINFRKIESYRSFKKEMEQR